MNFKRFSVITTAAVSLAGLVGCGPKPVDPVVTKNFNFSVSLESHSQNNVIYMGSTDTIAINTSVTPATVVPTYTFSLSEGGEEYVSVVKVENSNTYTVTPKAVTPENTTVDVTFKGTATFDDNTTKRVQKSISLTVKNKIDPQKAGKNYAADDVKRTEILGKLESYAMENFLTGITLFEQGAYVRYNDRIQIPASEYITGYGWGILTEGKLTKPLTHPEIEFPTYLYSGTSSDPLKINAWDDTGSQVSDLNGYISSSYWSTRMKGTDAYEWYPVLAKDKVNGKDYVRPTPLQVNPSTGNIEEVELDLSKEEDKSKTFKKWRVYVKTGAEEGIAYRTNSQLSELSTKFDGRLIALEDYEFVFQMLLTETSKLTRGSELALDTSYGIKGGQGYYRRTTGKKDADECTALWNSMKASGELGISTGTNTNGSYIDIELLSPVNSFYGMYYLSSSLYSPMPREYLEEIGKLNGYTTYMDAAKWVYGTSKTPFGDTYKNAFVDNTLCVGPFYLEKWDVEQQQVFKRNDNWYECQGEQRTRYLIPGVVYSVVSQQQEHDDAIYQEFKIGKLDSTSIPQSKMSEKLPTDKKNVGDATFKLNVNSCDQARWNSLFGDNGSIRQDGDNTYLVKPWMANNNFLKGLFWSINRQAFADARGVTPSINYFADAYMSDGEKGKSYNATDAHKEAIKNFHSSTKEDYGFNLTKSREFFSMAVQELVNAGQLELGKSASQPTEIHISIKWMYQSDIRDYGDEIGNYFADAFNDPSVCGGLVKLVIDQSAVQQWDQVYNDYLMRGRYDLAFGAISGNTLNPLNFMEVLKSDNSSGFTLNWGNDTSKVDERTPIIYEDKAWSYDAIWAAADHGAVVNEGKDVNPVDHAYMTSKDGDKNELYQGGEGCTLEIPFSFVDVKEEDGVKLELTNVQIFLLGVGAINLDASKGEYTIHDGKIIIPISKTQGASWNSQIVEANKLEERAEKEKNPDLLTPFTRDNYDYWWDVEITYSITIDKGVPSENVYYVSRSKAEDDKQRSLAVC